jgi:hypothetical protein
MFREATDDDFAPRPARSAPTGPAGFFEIVGAAWDAERIETDWHNYMGRRYGERYDEAWSALTSALGEDGAREALAARGVTFSERRDARRAFTNFQARNGAALLEAVSDLNPDLYGTFPRTPRDLLAEVNAEVRAEYEDASNTLAMGGAGSGLAEFLGRGAAATTDEVSLLMLPLGAGSGSIARVMLTEAALGAAAEAAVLPRMYEQSERLDIPEPNAAAQIALGGAFGGILGGMGEGLRRAIVYSRIRQEIAALPDGLSAPEAQAAVEAAVQAMEAGRPLSDQEIDDLGLFQVTERPAEAAPARERFPTEEEIEQARRDIIADNPELDRNRPTMDFLRQSGGIQWTRTNPNTGERELTPIASELQGMGISQRQLLGILRRDGMADVDNIVAADFADGGTPRLRTDDTGTYLARDALIKAIVQEAGGRPAYRTAEAEAAATRLADLEESFERIAREQDEVARVEGVDPRSGLNPPVEGDDALARADAAERIDMAYEADGADIPGSIRRDAQRIMADEGGDYEDALYDAILRAERERSDAGTQAPQASGTEALPLDDAGTGAGRAQPAAAADAGGVQARSGDVQRRTEQTAAGEQFVTPGVEPVSLRESLEASMDAPMRGGDALANDGLFDLNARLQRDMFDDPDNASMQAKYDEREAELREAWDGLEDVAVELEGETVTARQLLSDLEADRAHRQAIETCGWTGRGGAE